MKHYLLLVVSILMLTLTSCQFSENIYINEDGSGKMEFSMDASEMMAALGDMGEGEETGMDKAIDSTIVFKELFDEKRDSISKLPAEEQEKLKALEKFSMHMVMDPESKKMVFDMFTDFKSPNELQDMFSAMNSFSNLNGKGGTTGSPGAGDSPLAALGKEGVTEVQYAYDGSVFKRMARIIDKEKHAQAMDSLGQAAMMFGSSRYKINYHFPRPVKSISKEGAMYSEDRKTVTLEVGFMDLMKDPKLLDFEIALED